MIKEADLTDEQLIHSYLIIHRVGSNNAPETYFAHFSYHNSHWYNNDEYSEVYQYGKIIGSGTSISYSLNTHSGNFSTYYAGTSDMSNNYMYNTETIEVYA